MATSEDGALLTMEIPNRDGAASAARKALTSLNGTLHLVSEARLRDAQLLVSEVVTNALRHSSVPDEGVELSVLATPEVLRIEVRDTGSGFTPQPRAAGHVGGWGLHIVGKVADRWGVETAEGTTVWFEVDRPLRE